MPQSLAALYVHLVFSTKHRRPFLRDQGMRDEMHSYLGGTSAELGYAPILVGGVEDHVHILARQSRTRTVADWTGQLKSNSTKWIKVKGANWSLFSWQAGYGAFSVGPNDLPRLRAYISNQESHHRKLSFQEEFRALLAEHELEWDEQYVWD